MAILHAGLSKRGGWPPVFLAHRTMLIAFRPEQAKGCVFFGGNTKKCRSQNPIAMVGIERGCVLPHFGFD